jgi:hypothetical protein
MHLPVVDWTKRDLLDFMGIPESEFSSDQIQGTVIFMSREFATTFCEQWSEIMVKDNFRFLDDSPSKKQEFTNFKEHRHDQSILSLLLRKQEVKSFITEEQFYFPPDWKNAKEFPIWTTRNRTRVKLHDNSTKGKLLRFVDTFFAKSYKALSKIGLSNTFSLSQYSNRNG